MNREAQSVLLLLVGGAVLRISLSDVYLRYVKEGLRPFLIVAGALLVVIAVATLWREIFTNKDDAVVITPSGSKDALADDAGERAEVEGAPSPASPAHGLPVQDDDGHGHSHHGPRVAWLLVLPVFATFLVAPPALGSYAASREGAASIQQPQSEFPPLPRGDVVPLTVVDYVTRSIWDDGKSMEGRTVKLVGFVTPRRDGGAYLTRIMLSCCAADGRPLKIGLSGDAPDALKADTWIEVTGRYDPRTEKDRANEVAIPYLSVETIKQVKAPRQPYEQ